MLLCMGVKHGHTTKEMQLKEKIGKMGYCCVQCDICGVSSIMTWDYLCRAILK